MASVKIRTVKTPVLRQAYEESGPEGGERLLLVHGWPDSPRTWDKVLPALHEAGYRTVVPYLRGFGRSAFRDPLLGRKPRRTGQPVAMAQDMIDLADRLRMETFHFVGHDWGARTGYALAALFPKRLKSLVTVSVPFAPGEPAPPKLPQAKASWYQWLLCTIPGEKKFREDPIAFCKAQWDAWSPAGWYSEDDFKAAATSWTGKSFEDVVLHAYRSRWEHAEKDPKYAKLQAKFMDIRILDARTTLIQGHEDRSQLAESTDGAGKHFSADYERVLVPGVGHFPQRENPEAFARAVLRHLRAL